MLHINLISFDLRKNLSREGGGGLPTALTELYFWLSSHATLGLGLLCIQNWRARPRIIHSCACFDNQDDGATVLCGPFQSSDFVSTKRHGRI